MNTNIYLARAIEAYPYELETAIEALNYALSYEPENTKALVLMAKVQYEQFGDIAIAKIYYEKALASNIEYSEIYPGYLKLLIANEDFEEAYKLAMFALSIKGIEKAVIKLNLGYLFESKNEYDKALIAFKESKMHTLNNDFVSFVKGEIARVKKKKKEQIK